MYECAEDVSATDGSSANKLWLDTLGKSISRVGAVELYCALHKCTLTF